MSHDLQNPLNAAQGHVALAAKTQRDDTGEHLEAAADAPDRIETIADHTLTLAREGESVGDTEAVSLADVAADSWDTVDTGASSLDIETDREVHADPDRLQNLFENLIDNQWNTPATR